MERTSSRAGPLAAGFVLVTVMYAVMSRVWLDTSSDWYLELDKPWFQPPDWVFGVVWPLNFLALAVVGVLVTRRDPERAPWLLGVYGVSVVCALGWSSLFSEARELAPSAVALVAAAVLTWVLLVLAWRVRPLLGAGLLVYAAWMTLASALSVGIARLN